MQLQTVIDHLKTGEFSLANLGGNDEENISSNNLSTVINYINLGLIAIYTRFNLSLRELYIDQYAHIQKYKLHSKHAVSNEESDEIKYLVDTVDDPFTNDILKIVSVFNEIGCELPLNDSAKCDSLFTPKYNVLQIPCPVDGNTVLVLYRAAPEFLKVNCDFKQEVDLPITFLEPLLYFVASRHFATRPSPDDLVQSNNYATKFENALTQIELEGLYNTDNTSNFKLIARGFV